MSTPTDPARQLADYPPGGSESGGGLSAAATATLAAAGITPAEWAQRWFGDPEWAGDACGCTDDRCITYHHGEGQPCGCLRVLLETASVPCDDLTEVADAARAHLGAS